MRLVFLGTPAFAVPTLEAIVRAGHEVAAVVTQPDRPRGRGQNPAASAGEGSGARARACPSTSRNACAGPKPWSTCARWRRTPWWWWATGRSSRSRDRPGAARHHQRARLAAAEVPRRRTHPVGHRQRRDPHRRDHHADRRRARYRRHAAQGGDRRSAPRRTRSNSASGLPALGAELLVETLERTGGGTIVPEPQDSVAGHLRADPEEGRRPDRLDAAGTGDPQSRARLAALAGRADYVSRPARCTIWKSARGPPRGPGEPRRRAAARRAAGGRRAARARWNCSKCSWKAASACRPPISRTASV